MTSRRIERDMKYYRKHIRNAKSELEKWAVLKICLLYVNNNNLEEAYAEDVEQYKKEYEMLDKKLS